MKFVLCVLVFLIVAPLYAFQSIVVLPFNNESQKDEIYWLGEGFAESLSEELLLKEAYVIQRPERKAVYDALHLPYSGDLSRATMLKIGEQLSADYVVFGSFNLKENQLNARAKVIKISSAKLSSLIQASGSLNNLYQIQAAVRDELKKYFATEHLTPAAQSSVEAQSVPLHAYELYIKGLLEPDDSGKIQFFQRATDVLPSYAHATYRQGLALSRLGRYKESNDCLKRLSFSGALRPKVDFMIGQNLYQLHDYDGAFQKWSELAKTDPSAEVNNNVAVALMKKNDFQNSGWYLTQATTLDPAGEDYHFNLALSYFQRKYDAQAIQQFREALRYRPNDYQSLYMIAKILEQQGNAYSKTVMLLFAEALPADQKGKFPELYPSMMQILRAVPAFLSREEKQYLALSQANARKQREEYVKTYQSTARRHIEDEHPDQAIVEIHKGLMFAPFDWYLHYLWGRALYDQRNLGAAVPQLGFSIWCADNPDSHILLAEIYKDVEQYADAKAQIQQCLALDPKNKRALDIWNKIWNKN